MFFYSPFKVRCESNIDSTIKTTLYGINNISHNKSYLINLHSLPAGRQVSIELWGHIIQSQKYCFFSVNQMPGLLMNGIGFTVKPDFSLYNLHPDA
jgi:threonine/homoserine efflux transporter RhtA